MAGPGVIAPATSSVGVELGVPGGAELVAVAEGVGTAGVVPPPFDGGIAVDEGVAVPEGEVVAVEPGVVVVVAVDVPTAVVVVVAEGLVVPVVDIVGNPAADVLVGTAVLVGVDVGVFVAELVGVFVAVLPAAPWTTIEPSCRDTDESSTGSPPLSVPLRVTFVRTAMVEPDASACHPIVNKGQFPGPEHSLNRARARVRVPSEVDGDGIAISQPGSTVVESIVTIAGLYVMVTSKPSRVSAAASETLT